MKTKVSTRVTRGHRGTEAQEAQEAQRHSPRCRLAEGTEERAVRTFDSVGFDTVDDGWAPEPGLKASPNITRNPS